MAETPRYLLDTHIWFWLVRGREGRLAPRTAATLKHAALRAPLGVSVISVWEIALLASKGRISLGMPVKEWIESALNRPGFVLADLDAGIAIESCSLPGAFHVDPSDRFLVATARLKNAMIATRDQRIRSAGPREGDGCLIAGSRKAPPVPLKQVCIAVLSWLRAITLRPGHRLYCNRTAT